MADSDEEYVGDVTEDEDDFPVSRNDRTRAGKRKQRGGAEWELSRTWETLVEGADGTISSTVEGLLEAGKRKRQGYRPGSCRLVTDCIARQVVERYDSFTARHHSTCHPGPRSFSVHVREGPAAHAIPLDTSIRAGVRARVL